MEQKGRVGGEGGEKSAPLGEARNHIPHAHDSHKTLSNAKPLI